MLPQEALLEFNDLYKKNFGKELSPDSLDQTANAFFNLIKLLSNLPKPEQEGLLVPNK